MTTQRAAARMADNHRRRRIESPPANRKERWLIQLVSYDCALTSWIALPFTATAPNRRGCPQPDAQADRRGAGGKKLIVEGWEFSGPYFAFARHQMGLSLRKNRSPSDNEERPSDLEVGRTPAR